MIINSFAQIKRHLLADIKNLCERCRRADHNIIAIYPHLLDKPRPILCNLLCYDKKKLIGFLRPFFFYENSCEIAMMVAPSHRRQGIARQMLQTILPYLNTVESLVFSVPADNDTKWLSDMGLTYTSSQNEMRYILTPLNKKHRPHEPEIRLATPNDLDQICIIHNECFPASNSNLHNYFGINAGR